MRGTASRITLTCATVQPPRLYRVIPQSHLAANHLAEIEHLSTSRLVSSSGVVVAQLSNMDVDEDALTFLLIHMFLPPRLPQKLEEELPALEHYMLLFVRDAFQRFVNENCPEHRPSLEPTLDMLKNWVDYKASNESTETNSHHLERILKDFEPGG